MTPITSTTRTGVRVTRVAVLIAIAFPLGVHAQAASLPDSQSGHFRRLVIDRIAAEAAADTAALRRLFDPDMVYIDNDGSRRTTNQRMKQIAASGKDESMRHDVDSVHVARAADLSLVDYRITNTMSFGSRSVAWQYRALDTFILRGREWLLLRHAETAALAVPAAITMDSAALAEYVGRYAWWPGNVDTITLRGNQLWHKLTVENRAIPVVAVTPESFHEVGDPTLVVFVRDKSGRIVGYVMHFLDGQVLRARRLP